MIKNDELNSRVLVVEDDVPTAELERFVLLRSGKKSLTACRVDEAVEQLQRGHFSAVLLDYLLPDGNGWKVLEAAQAAVPPIPVIVVTGRGSEEIAAEALRRGAADYVIKNGDYWKHLPNIVDRSVKGADAERLRNCLASMVEGSADAIIGGTGQGAVATWNLGAARMFGYTAVEARSMPVLDLFPAERRSQVVDALERVQNGEHVPNFETVGLTHNGKLIHVSVGISPADDDAMPDVSVSIVARDVTERKHAESELRALEHELRQLQKLDAVQEIAGGVAHEFNNLLTVIIGHSELIMNRLPEADPVRSELGLVVSAGQRAAKVTRQLVSFSRQQMLSPRIINLNIAVNEAQRQLRRILRHDIQIEAMTSPDLEMVKVDPALIEEVIVCLAMNAGDAMPDGGNLRVETANVTLDDDYARTHAGCKPGRYVMLAISDTGCGMDQATQSRIFDPFYTTKDRSSSAGLGLSMVYGTVKQSDGFIYVSSQPRNGTRFEIFLPCVEAAVPKPGDSSSHADLRGKTILVADDDHNVLELAKDILSLNEYTVLTASSSAEAAQLAELHRNKIDLLVTDLNMPNESGSELARRLRAGIPGLKVIYMSGYDDEDIQAADPGAEHLAKPFSVSGLQEKVLQVLQGNGSAELRLR